MKKGLRWGFHLANAVVGGSGVVLLVMIFFVVPVDEWSVVNHPWQPLFQHIHVLSAPLMVFVLGVIWARHVQPKLVSAAPGGKRSGLALVPPTVVMAASGYLLQIAVDQWWRELWSGLHVVVSVAWLVIFVMHLVAAVVTRRRAAKEQNEISI